MPCQTFLCNLEETTEVHSIPSGVHYDHDNIGTIETRGGRDVIRIPGKPQASAGRRTPRNCFGAITSVFFSSASRRPTVLPTVTRDSDREWLSNFRAQSRNPTPVVMLLIFVRLTIFDAFRGFRHRHIPVVIGSRILTKLSSCRQNAPFCEYSWSATSHSDELTGTSPP